MKIPDALAPFRSRNYRLFYSGHAISLTGSWITQTAIGWLVYALTNSTVMSGLAMFLSQVSHFFVTPVAGVMIDRVNRRTMLLAVQFGALASAAGLMFFQLFDGNAVWILMTLCFVRGLVGAVEIPTRQSLIAKFIDDKRDLPQAIGLNSTLFNFTRIVAPAIAGEVYALWGAACCFALDTVLMIPTIFLLAAMRFDAKPVPAGANCGPLCSLLEGIRYTFSVPVLRTVICGIALLSTFGFSYTVLLPMFADKIYEGTPELYGRMLTVTGVGAILAALLIAFLKRRRLLPRFLIIGNAIVGTSLIVISLVPPLWLFFVMLFTAGFGSVLVGASSNTLVQMNLCERFRGRVISLYTMAFTGTFPFGTLLLGAVNEAAGLVPSLGLSAAVCLGLAMWFWIRRKIFR
ncbi:MAG: MFS transporter [Opitutales bacterium]|nr:MFS transporter [Opitutales bacterium]